VSGGNHGTSGAGGPTSTPSTGTATRPISGRGLVALAAAGGLLPSPTAFVVLTGAVSAHRVGYGLTLVGAFSVGLAAALMAVGMLALRARAVVSARLSGRFASWLPVLSAAVIGGFGAFVLVRGITQL
jgi:nickel/cobalt transporter (NicO) family protein